MKKIRFEQGFWSSFGDIFRLTALIIGLITALWFVYSCPKGTNATGGDFHEIPSLQYKRKKNHDFLHSR